MSTVELLAPAGNRGALHAAVSAGADAVYLGLESFNARRGADNFTLESLEDACTYAHLRGVRVYVTLNTIILPSEVTDALECARQAYLAGVDAFIIQDIGFAVQLVRLIPDIRLHISTQMNVHSVAGIRAAAHLGARRVTLARELSLEEVAYLAKEARLCGLEVEVFVHGALCVCYSGQCLMSSMIGGRSANRGMCAQACRLPYTLVDCDDRNMLFDVAGDHLLSPRDLCAIDLLGDLVSAGVASFKIEGRMKSAEYVSSVTRVYRAALDRMLCSGNGEDNSAGDISYKKNDQDDLAVAFSRGFTTAYLEGVRGNEIMSYQRPNNRGQFVGRVDSVDDNRVVIATNYNLVISDIIEFWTRHGHTALTIDDIVPCGDSRFSVSLSGCTQKPHVGDRVFRVKSAQAAFCDNEFEPRISVVGKVILHIGRPLHIEFHLASPAEIKKYSNASCAENTKNFKGESESLEWWGENLLSCTIAQRHIDAFGSRMPLGCAEGSIVEHARTKEVSAAEIYEHTNRLGSTPFELIYLKVDLDVDVGIGFSEIHQIRAQALENLSDEICATTAHRHLTSMASFDKLCKHPSMQKSDYFVSALVSDSACARIAQSSGAKRVYVHALSFISDDDLKDGYSNEYAIMLPVVDHNPIGLSREAHLGINIWDNLDSCALVVAENLAQMQRAQECGMPFEVGSHVPIANELSMAVAQDFGAKRVWLSPELTLHQIEDIASRACMPLGIIVAGAQEIMVCEHCLLMSRGACNEQCASCVRRRSHHVLRDRKDFEFPVMTDMLGRSHIYNSVSLDIVPAIPDLISVGVSSFMVDATLLTPEQTRLALERVTLALEMARAHEGSVGKISNTTSGHLYRGVS